MPAYLPTMASNAGVLNYTYMVQGSFGSLFASDISVYTTSQKQLGYSANLLKFHYPSENSVNGVYYDLELQIYHTNMLQVG